jgi:hypothetical protein
MKNRGTGIKNEVKNREGARKGSKKHRRIYLQDRFSGLN